METRRTRVWSHSVMFVLLGMAAWISGSEAVSACPAYIHAKDIALPEGPRQNIRLYARQGEPGQRQWVSLPVQVDPLDEKGVLRGPQNDKEELSAQPVTPLDRLSLRREGFGPKVEPGAPPPCKATRFLELRSPDHEDAYAYLAMCADAPALTAKNPVSHDVARRKVSAGRFDYEYQPNNQLMYRSLSAKTLHGTNKPVLAASDADLNLHLDIRKFFTLDFTNKDVESYVGHTSFGPVGMVGSIDFYLRLLFLKIDLKMGTTVGFYDDAAHVPAVFDVPRNAPDMLHPGSGMLYMWRNKAARVDQSRPEVTMPNADPKRILSGWQLSSKTGLRYCHAKAEMCVFRMRGTVNQEHFGLDVNVPRSMVERGFYPQWVPDVAKFKKEMDWDDDPDEEPATVAVFFDNGGLMRGLYTIDQWLRVGTPEEIATPCPRPVVIGSSVNFAH